MKCFILITLYEKYFYVNLYRDTVSLNSQLQLSLCALWLQKKELKKRLYVILSFEINGLFLYFTLILAWSILYLNGNNVFF